MTIPLETGVHEQTAPESPAPHRGESRPTNGTRPDERGSVREVALLAYPVVLTQLSMTTMGVVDSAMVGRLGASALGAVGFGNIWTWTIFCCFMGAATGVQTFVSQYHGAEEPERCGEWPWHGIWSLVPFALLTALTLLLCLDPLLALLAPSPELRPLAHAYMSIRAFGAVGMCTAVVFSAFFRGIGDTRTPLYVTLFANVVNCILDYGLIFGRLGLPEWGVAGAATATAIAEWVYAVVMIGVFLRPAIRHVHRTAPRLLQLREQRRLLRVGIPIGGQWVVEMLSFAFFLTLVARMGDAAMAASQAFIALLSLSFMQAVGLGIAVSTLVGRYIGAEDPESAEQSFRSGMKLTVWLSGGVALLFLAVPDPLLRIFTSDPEVMRLGVPLLAVGAVFQFFDAFGIMTDGALRGAGDTRVPFLVRSLLSWGLFLPMAWLFGVHWKGGLTVAWAAGTFSVVLLSVYLIWRFRSGAWRQIRI